MTLSGATTPISPAQDIHWDDWKLGYQAGQRDAIKERHIELVEALKSEGQKDEWIEMLSESFRSIVVAVSGNDDWEGSVADGIDVLNLKFKEVNAALDKQHEQVVALTHAIEALRGEMLALANNEDHFPAFDNVTLHWVGKLAAILKGTKTES